jgi:hypothetical protein
VGAPRFVQNIPLGGNDVCGVVPPVAASQREAQSAAWKFREVRDLHTAKTDSRGRYSIKAPEGNYELVAFRLAPASGPLFAVKLGPRADGTVDLAAGQTVAQDLTLLNQAPAASVNGPQPPDAADWPAVFEGPVRARGSVCLNVASVPADALVAIGVAFQPALPPSQVTSEMHGVRRSGSPDAAAIPDMLWVKKGRDLDKSRTFKISFGKPVADAKVQVIGYTPGAGYGPVRVTLCK